MVRPPRLPLLDRKLLRDLWHLRGAFAAVALVVASGIALFVSLRSMHGYLLGAQRDYYASGRFADVFATAERAPLRLGEKVREIPGVAAVETRIVAEALLDVPGLEEPATGRLVSIPVPRRPTLNDLHLRRGRWPAPGARDEVLASDAFARANRLAPAIDPRRGAQRPLAAAADRRAPRSRPSSSTRFAAPATCCPTIAASASSGCRARRSPPPSTSRGHSTTWW